MVEQSIDQFCEKSAKMFIDPISNDIPINISVNLLTYIPISAYNRVERILCSLRKVVCNMSYEREASIRDMMNSIVPISRFNRGEANRIFDEVHDRGVKVVLKNNAPVCVLVEPERYERMLDTLEDYALFLEARHREAVNDGKALSHENVLAELDIHPEALADIEVDIE